ncbi:amidohydrolase family protein [Chryseolinea sp. H1M3-3]|uniref:amidohydrolase family protein n=1 Tax=Chryseolinea sp. H1M3-3 TaxID=3034144 RepID=UPI0023EC185A|nr:amidohydrolase family protein [Chryseolinea sp. H1M3-3]
MRIDSHHHLWKYNDERDRWITDDMAVIQRNFLPEDLKPILHANHIDGTVLVQTDQSKEENIFLLANALQHDFIKGVVGWIDLQARDVTDHLAYYKEFKKLKGFRHILQGEEQRDFMLRPDFKRGIGKLKEHGYTYDILVYPDQLKYTVEFVKEFPDQPFVLDHLAKPYIKDKRIDDWKKDIQALAVLDNVFCKVSGMVTEADWKSWSQNDLRPYLDVVVESFGIARLMYGSDWPVCLVAASYEKVIDVTLNYFSSFSEHEQDLIFGKNATRFYNL